MNTQLIKQITQISLDDQLELIEAIWNNISKHNSFPQPTNAQKLELDRRIADLDANPDDVIPWSEVKIDTLAHIKRL